MTNTIQARVIVNPVNKSDFSSIDFNVKIPADTKPDKYLICAFHQAKKVIYRLEIINGFRFQVMIPREYAKEKRKTLYEVTFRHRMTDALAPKLLVEMEYSSNPNDLSDRVREEGLKLSRLADFPNVWEMTIKQSPRLYNCGKYYLPEEFKYKFNKIVEVEPPTSQVRLVDQYGQYSGQVSLTIVVDGNIVFDVTEETPQLNYLKSKIS